MSKFVAENGRWTRYGDPKGINVIRYKSSSQLDSLRFGDRHICQLRHEESTALLRQMGEGETF